MVAISSFFTVILAAAASVSALPTMVVERAAAAPADVATKFLTAYKNMYVSVLLDLSLYPDH